MLVREAPIALFVIERRREAGWNIVYCSPTFLSQTGIDPSDFTDHHRWDERVHPEDRAEKDRQWNLYCDNGESSLTFRALDASGKYRWIYNELKRVESGDPDLVDMAVGVVMNIDKRKRDEARIEAASRLITLGEIATGMAHELNQPLNVIRMAVQNVELRFESDQLPDDLRSYLKEKLLRINAQTQRAAGIIENMRIFGSGSGSEPGPFDVNDALIVSLDIMAPRLKGAGIEIEAKLGSALPAVFGQTQRLEQVFINLLLNACDAIVQRQSSEPAGAYTGQIAITTLSEDDKVVVRISDNGCGMPQEVVERIFEPFFTTKTIGNGTGLGLSLSHGIVTEYGGKITVQSDSAVTTFEVRLPLCDEIREGGLSAMEKADA